MNDRYQTHIVRTDDVTLDQVPSFCKALLTCPIAIDIFQDPVIAMDNKKYEQSAILHWFSMHRNTGKLTNPNSPMTNLELKSTFLRDNIDTRNLISNISDDLKKASAELALPPRCDNPDSDSTVARGPNRNRKSKKNTKKHRSRAAITRANLAKRIMNTVREPFKAYLDVLKNK